MGTLKKTITICFLLGLLFSGCKKQSLHIPSTVTQIHVTGTLARRPVQRQYTGSETMEFVLNYLRTLDFDGFTSLDPTLLPGDDFVITLFFSDNTSKLYRVHSNRYLCHPDGKWEKVDAEKAGRLASIIQTYRSDL